MRICTCPLALASQVALSLARADAHPGGWVNRGLRAVANVCGNVRDCMHWCLPGVPDTWARLIQAVLILSLIHI